MPDSELILSFSSGTILIEGDSSVIKLALPCFEGLALFDERVQLYRAEAYSYAPLVLGLRKAGIPYKDAVKDFTPENFRLLQSFPPLKHQQEALDAWLANSGRGVAVMPTGSGKSYLAMLAIAEIKRPALIIVPTIDLMLQWASQIEKFFGIKPGMIGGGSRDYGKITVSTYDSAVIHMEFIGNRFGLVIFDECHHLPGAVNRTAATMCIAPYRLGLTATPEREDGGEELLYKLSGPNVYTVHIDELEGKVLSPYLTRQLRVQLDPDELEDYKKNRLIYTNFLKANAITFESHDDWSRFIILCARRPGGRDVMNAYMKQKRIARSGRAKIRLLWELLRKHAGDRTIIFTAENETAYHIAKIFFLPVITHRTSPAERKDFLSKFRSGEYPVLVTSKVLNEGVDVPEASLGIVVSGSGSRREHVQRLGRILRAKAGKDQALLYEIISENTSEVNVSIRRRDHRAYQRSFKIPKQG